MEKKDTLTSTQVSESEGLEDWRVLLRSLHSSFKTGSMAKGLDFASRVGAAADEANHHPDLTVTYPRVHVLLTTHDADGLTQRDVDLARKISAIAKELGIAAEPSVVASLEIAIDALDIPRVKPFWEAVLGYKPHSDDDCVDPYGRGPAFWFQQMDAPRPQRNRIHIDVTVPARRRRTAHRRGARGRRHAGLGRGGARVLGARRSRGQRGLHLHLAGPGLRT